MLRAAGVLKLELSAIYNRRTYCQGMLMKTKIFFQWPAWTLCASAVFLFAQPPSIGQQTTGVAGSPDATTTLDGKQLPAPDPTFKGTIKDNAAQSKAWWAPRVVPPSEAPNVLLIMTDDVGFGARAHLAESSRRQRST